MSGYTLDSLQITETFYGWYNKTNDIIDLLNSVVGDGISGASLDSENHLIFTLIDGTTLDAGYVVGPTGTSVDSAVVNGDGDLIITLDDTTTINAGYVIGSTGETGATGDSGPTGATGITGETGQGVPTGGFAGYALVKTSDSDYDTEWGDVSSLSRAHPGKIGGYEAGTGDYIFGRGLNQSGRELYPRWQTNYYMSQVHKGPGISMNANAGLYTVAGEMVGFTTGYDDGLTSGIKVLNFLENTLPFDSNVFTSGGCLGQTLNGPPGYYWNRMKYFPTVKLQPFYVGSYSYVDRYILYVAGYESGATATSGDLSKRRGTYGWFGIIQNNSFPVGTPESEANPFSGFVPGSTCAYFFRPEDAALDSGGFAVTVSDSNFDAIGISYAAWTGDYVQEIGAGRTGPIALFPTASGTGGLSAGFVLAPGWYYFASEFIPTAWFSVGSSIDPIAEEESEIKGACADHVILTHTDAASGYGDAALFGLNGFELAPADEATGVGTPFIPSAYLGVSSLKANMTTMPTGLPPHLWYTQGLSGETAGGRFGQTGSDLFLVSHQGLHPIDSTVDDEAAITIRAQNAQQASAPRIAISIKSSASQRDSLRELDPINTDAIEGQCQYYWDGSVSRIVDPSYSGGGAFNAPFTTDFSNDADGPSWLFAMFGSDSGVTFTSLPCPDGTCPEFLAPPHHGGTWGQIAPADQNSEFPADWIFNEFGTILNPQGLTTDGIYGNTSEGRIEIVGTGGNTFYYGFGLGVPLGTSGDLIEGCTSGITSASDGGGFYSNWTFGDIEPVSIPASPITGINSGIEATISVFVNAQEPLHKQWYGEVSGTEKNHLVKYTATFGCSADGPYPEYGGPS